MHRREWIAYVGQFPFPDGSACSRRVLGISQSLACGGADVGVGAVDTPCSPWTNLTSSSGETIRYQGLGAFCSTWSAPRKAAAIAWTSARQTAIWLDKKDPRPSAVIVFGASASFISQVLRWCRRNKVALICDVVEWYHPRQVIGGIWMPLYWSGEYAMRRLLPRVDGLITISSLLTNYYRGQGCRVIQIPPTLDVCATASASLKAAANGRINLVYAGVPAKKDLLSNVLEGLKQVDPEGSRFCLKLVGPDRVAVQGLCPGYPEKAVVFAGRRTHDETLEIVRQADFSVLLRPDKRYAHAGFPTKVAESLACGTPVICNLTSDLGNYVRDGQEGVICSDHTAEAFADALRRVAGLSSERRQQMGQAARMQAEQSFDYRRYTSGLRGFMADVTARVQRDHVTA